MDSYRKWEISQRIEELIKAIARYPTKSRIEEKVRLEYELKQS